MMSKSVEFNDAAFKHGISEERIRYALNRPQYEGSLEDDVNKYIVLGFDNSGNLLEIMYNDIEGNGISIFHAMKCRSIFFPLMDA